MVDPEGALLGNDASHQLWFSAFAPAASLPNGFSKTSRVPGGGSMPVRAWQVRSVTAGGKREVDHDTAVAGVEQSAPFALRGDVGLDVRVDFTTAASRSPVAPAAANDSAAREGQRSSSQS